MPINLTTPISAGDTDPNSPYNQAKIVSWHFVDDLEDSQKGAITIIIEYGNTIGNVWTPAAHLPQKTIDIQDRPAIGLEGTDGYQPEVTGYTDYVAAALTAGAGASLYEEMKTSLYTHIMSVDPALAGTIV
jgi:hypothetical protein